METAGSDYPLLAIVAVCAYLAGSIPFGLIFTRLGGKGDIRKIGSGNIGATNVLRTGSKLLAVLTMLCDAGKGAAAVLVAGYYGETAVTVAAIAAMVGHIFPVWLGFRGGKAVATAGGILLALAWPVGLAVLLTWLAVAIATRYSSLAALVAAALGPLYAYFFAPGAIATTVVLLVLIVYRHKENIERLMAGTESKIGG
jgi:glycerol-3-phosphate acyltransferase PlsY